GWGCEGGLDLGESERYQGFQAIVDTNGQCRIPTPKMSSVNKPDFCPGALGFGGRLICGVYRRAIEVIYGC
ncbi:hypothetical protein, partial [Microcoleus anatoxicus]|uniref:hypothetical protein n=1 Tax=Microcoleus anatoxicus TaxID=2705319 RepID=UPI0030C9A9F8